MDSRVFCSSVIGPGNRHRGAKKQDAAMLRRLHEGWLMVVCDGLGSHQHSDLGAQQACLAVRDIILEMGMMPDPHLFAESVHRLWVERLAPLLPAEAATTCLIACISDNGRGFIAQLGDGLILLRQDQYFQRMTPDREGFSDQTSALSTRYCFDDWFFHVGEISASGDGVVLMTDGISEDLDPDRLEDFFSMLCRDSLSRRRQQMQRWLTLQLHEWPTPGHSDDKTIAGFFRI